jgi:hypothetical protein
MANFITPVGSDFNLVLYPILSNSVIRSIKPVNGSVSYFCHAHCIPDFGDFPAWENRQTQGINKNKNIRAFSLFILLIDYNSNLRFDNHILTKSSEK